ncbi:MAG TPA: prepilin-type N-terminal cleavage/methylation domain-containing protein [Gaiellaceae bacterium]|nr:prepilin-type N-terminal cleavage/methylation domain-containing protein [Gaiellaceae bacterium]
MIRDERGFTLIELLVVVAVVAVLVAIAVPAYGGLRDRADARSSQHALRQTLVAANAYQVDNDDFSSMTLAKLRKTYDAGIPTGLTLSKKTADYFCLKTVSASGKTYWLRGPENIATVGSKKADRPTGC